MFALIDLNNFFARFYYGNKENCIENYLRFNKKIISTFSPDHLCNCIDGPVSFRKNIYSEYKANREQKPKEYYDLLENCIFNLQKQGFPIQSAKTLEADDIISLFISNISDEFIVFSNDKDLLQLETENVKIFDYDKREFVKKSYQDKGLCNKEEFLLYLALKGDVSDNIKGVKGIGEKRALDIAKKYGNYETVLGLINFSPDLNRIKENLEDFKLSYLLIKLFIDKWEFDKSKYICVR